MNDGAGPFSAPRGAGGWEGELPQGTRKEALRCSCKNWYAAKYKIDIDSDKSKQTCKQHILNTNIQFEASEPSIWYASSWDSLQDGRDLWCVVRDKQS